MTPAGPLYINYVWNDAFRVAMDKMQQGPLGYTRMPAIGLAL